MECVNLKERFGDRYKIRFEESYHAERPDYRQQEAAWLMTIPCHNGHICPWGGRLLAACTNKAGPVAKRLKALSFTTVAQDGDDGANILFDVEYFDQVASVMRPKRRRRLSSEHRRRLTQAGAKYRFRSGSGAPETARKSKARRVTV